MKTYSNNFLKVALAIVLFSNSALLFYFVKQQKNQNSELTTLNTKLDLILKNKSESQSKQAACLNVFIEEEKTQELKPVRIKYVEEVVIENSVTEVVPIEPPIDEEYEVMNCGSMVLLEATPKEGMQSFYD